MPTRLSATRLPGPIDCIAPTVRLHGANPNLAPGDVHLLVGVQRAAGQRAGDDRAAAFRGERHGPPTGAAGRGRQPPASACTSSSSAARSSSRPAPVVALTGTIGAPAEERSGEPIADVQLLQLRATRRRPGRPWSGRRSRAAARPARGSAGAPRSAASTPPPASTTNMHASTPPTPASMLRRNRTWPGTSMKLMPAPLGSVVWAKPRSMVRPRLRSSSRRSGLVPGQRLDQRRLAVVDVTGGGDYAHRRSAAATTPSLPGSIVRRSSHVDPSRVRAMIGGSHDRSAVEMVAGDADADRGDRRAWCRAGSRHCLRSVRPRRRRQWRRSSAARVLQIVDRRGDHRPERDLGCRGLAEIGERRALHCGHHVPAGPQGTCQRMLLHTSRPGRHDRR